MSTAGVVTVLRVASWDAAPLATAILTGTARVRRESIPLDADRIVGFDHLYGDVGLVGRHVWHTFLTVMP